MQDDVLDAELVANGDSRNVVDGYKNWRLDAIADDMKNKAFNIHIAIENYQHDYNIGTIVRSANAFNVAGVHIVGKRHWNRRGAMSTEKYLQLYNHSSATDLQSWCNKNRLSVIGIDNIDGSIGLNEAVLPVDCMLVFGQEGPGLSPEMQAICQYLVAIEQFGSTRSVNVGVAAGIIMYEWVRRNEISK